MIALIDADSLLYKAGFTFEDKTNWNETAIEAGVTDVDDISYTSDIVNAKNAIDGLIENILFKTGCNSVELWLTGNDNFRYDVLDSYKHNRKESRKPLGYAELWDYLVTKYGAHVATGYEADDVVVYKKTTHHDDFFLCAIDKDVLLQTVGTHYNYGRDEFITVTAKEADRFFYYQVLRGDNVDGYKGCKGIGDVKANKLLDLAEEAGISYWTMVCTTYEDKGMAEEEAIQQARMASMHQLKELPDGSYTIELWTPPK